MAEPARSMANLARLRAMGLRIAIDDFGTGYSSLAYLHRMPLTELKIDRSFVQDMTRDESDAAIVRSTIELGHNLGLRIVAEGVEDEATWQLLGVLDCDSAQGFYWSGALPPGELRSWLSAHSETSDTATSILPSAVDEPRLSIVQPRRPVRASQPEIRDTQPTEIMARLAGGIAHDLNNLLTTVMTSSELLRDGLDAADPRQARLTQILDASERAADLVRHLVGLSRQRAARVTNLDLNVVLTIANRLVRRVLGERIQLETIKAPNLGLTRGDPGQIELALLNLAMHGRESMSEGGRLKIETENLEVDSPSTSLHDGMGPGAYMRLAVTIEGDGTADAERGRIPVGSRITGKSAWDGGPYLSTAERIIAEAGGEVRVHTSSRHSMRLSIYLPRVVEPTASAELVAEGEPALRGTEAVLVVEDDENILVGTALRARGYAVCEANRGETALETLEEQNRPFDLLITDLVMPGLNGGDLGREMLRRCPQTRVLYMSGFPGYSSDGPSWLLEAGLLEKPFTPLALARKVREVLDAPTQPTNWRAQGAIAA